MAGRRVVRHLAAGALLLLAACSSDDGGSTGAQSAVSPNTVTSTTAAAAEPQAQPSGGCATAAPAPVVEEERTLTVDGAARRYLITVPDAGDTADPLPLVLDFHGLMEGAEVHSAMTQYSALAEQEGFVVVFPHGTGDPLGWDVDPDPATNADLAYVDAVLEEVASAHCIDHTRIYATGLSMGAMFTSVLLCERGDVLAAAAPVAGLVAHEGCGSDDPVPVVSFHGTADPILLFNGGVDLSALPGGGGELAPPPTTTPVDLNGDGYPAAVAAFAERNGCAPGPIDTDVTEEVLHRVYDCPPGADVELYIVIGGGHSWPSSEFSRSIAEIVGHTTFDVDATADAWEFMSRFTTGSRS